jgi:hypothetical protein
MKARSFDRLIAAALAFGAIVFALLLAGVASGLLTSPAPYRP